MAKQIQMSMFEQLEILRTWEEEWQGMPEFIQANLKPEKTIMVHFEDIEDVKLFAEAIGQNVTSLTKSVWFPKTESRKPSDYRYVDES